MSLPPVAPITPSNSLPSSPVFASRRQSPAANSEDGYASGDDLDVLGHADAAGDFNEPDTSTPMWRALLACATSPGACTADTAATKVAINNNPRPMRSQTGDSAEYWVTTSGDFLTLEFPAVVECSSQSSHIGPYFNTVFSGLDFAALKRAKAQFDLRPLEDGDDAFQYPPEAIDCSRYAFETIMSLCGEVEDARNARVPPQKRPSFKPCWREKDNKWIIGVSTDPLFKDVPLQAVDKTPKINRNNIGKSKTLVSPSKVREQAAKKQNSATTREKVIKTGRGTNSWYITDLPDPDGRYAGLLAEFEQELQDVRVVSPDVRGCNGAFIHAGEYATSLKDGDIVEVEVSLKLWFIRNGNDKAGKDPNGARVYQLILKKMKLMPYDPYLKASMVQQAVGTGVQNSASGSRKGKRKMTENPAGESPTKKVAVPYDDDVMEFGDDL